MDHILVIVIDLVLSLVAHDLDKPRQQPQPTQHEVPKTPASRPERGTAEDHHQPQGARHD